MRRLRTASDNWLQASTVTVESTDLVEVLTWEVGEVQVWLFPLGTTVRKAKGQLCFSKLFP